MNNLKKLRSNKVILYLTTRYMTYFIQLLSSIIIAVKLGPYFFGVWGFILLLLSYFRIIDFGVSNAINILLVQNKKDNKKAKSISSNAIYLITLLNIVICLFGLYYKFIGISFFDKYEISSFFLMIIMVAIMTNYNVLFMNIYRIENSLKELSIYQSSIPILMFILAISLKGEILLAYLLYANVLGNIISLLVFYLGKKIPRLGKFNRAIAYEILNKGIFLFIYSISFYLIIISIKTLISIYYSVEEFGVFSFSYTLGNSVLLFLQAISFVVFPKIISKLKGNDFKSVRATINQIRQSYVSLAYGIVFLVLFFIPFFLFLIPKYQDAFNTLGLVILTVVLYTNSFGYGSFLMAQNLERKNAFISFFTLIINLILAFVLILIFKVSYTYVILATVFSYVLYAFLCVYFGKIKMGLKEGFIRDFNDCFPIRLFAPYCLALLLSILDYRYFMLAPLLMYIIFNRKPLISIIHTMKILINKPNVIDL